jgi:DNA-binding LacI/PurR family transcriptional regulator
VRAALKDLASQNLIIPGGNGRNHRIAVPSTLVKKAAKKAKRPRIIRYLSNEAFHELGELTTLIYRSAETKLAARGYKLVFEHEPGIYKRFSGSRLKQMANRPDTTGWILFRTTRPIQLWFEDMGIPAIVCGAAHPGVTLPAVRLDYGGACRHAALKFLDEGHDCLAIVTPLKRVAAEEESIRSFLSTKTERPDARFSLIEHDFSMPSIMNGILGSRLGKKPVTAYLVMEPQEAITVLNILHYSGVSVPGGASIISRFGDRTMSRVVPNIAHYLFDGPAIGRIITKTLLSVIEEKDSEALNLRESVPFQRFVPGGSTGRLSNTEVRTLGYKVST